MGPDHAQLEIWQESKHGVAFMARRDHQDLTVASGELTTEDQDVPTCSTCHMSGLNNLGMTHDVGERLSLYLFAPVTEKREGYEQGRINMQRVCTQCHSQTHVDEFYAQADGIVETVNTRVRESKAIYADLLERGLVTPEKFDEPIEFTEFNLWHHWGRTAKHGSFMGGADFVQWHGNYELLKDLVEMRTESAEMIEKAEAGH